MDLGKSLHFYWPVNSCAAASSIPAMEQIAVNDASLVGSPPSLLAEADFQAVVDLHRARIFRFLLSTIRDRDAAETLTQDCFLRAYQARDSFRGEASLATWLMSIAVNLMRDHLRSRRLRFWQRAQARSVDALDASDWLPDRASTPEQAAIARDSVRKMWEAVEELSARQRSVFVLRFVEEMELPEIAACTGMNLSTVKSHLYRALRLVRERVGGKENA